MKYKLFLLFCFCCYLLHSQPVITRSNYFFIGDSSLVSHKSDSSLVGFNTGPIGANAVWDFSGMDFTHPSVFVDTVIYITPVGTPFYPSHMAANYSQSNLCFVNKTSLFSPGNSDYNYCYIGNDSLSFIGHWATGGGTEIWEDHCTDFIKLLSFPFTYQDSFTDTFQRYFFDMSGSDEHYITGTHTLTADGYGTLITPDGNSIPDVLRLHSVESFRDSNALFGINSYTYHNYYWYSENHRGFILRFAMAGYDSTLISTADYQRQSNVTTSVANLNNYEGIILSQTPENLLVVSQSGSKAQPSNYAIFSIAGSLIASGRIDRVNSNIDCSGLSSGVYVIKIISEDRTSIFIEKFIIG